MKQATLFLLASLIVCILPLIVHGQTGFVSSGSSGVGDNISISLGQLTYLRHSGASAGIAGGMQRATGKITNKHFTACSTDTLKDIFVNVVGGEWSVNTAIGTSIDTTGILEIGTVNSNTLAWDTVLYTFNGYTDKSPIGVRKSIPLTCQDLSLITDFSGQVYLDSQSVVTMTQGALPSTASYSLSDTTLSCENGLSQKVKLNGLDTGVCRNCEISVSLIDTMRPVAGCPATEELVLVWIGTTLTPASFKGSTNDNCGLSRLEFSFSADFNQPSMVLSCREQLQLLDTVMVYIRDESGNKANCTISLSYDEANGEDCSCDWGALKLKGEISPNDYKASDYIIASGTITTGDTVTMKAENVIVFSPGFRVSNGSSLFARTDSCGKYTPEKLMVEDIEELVFRHEGGQYRGAEDGELFTSDILQMQAYPNPFQGWFKVRFLLEQAGLLNMELHNINGGQVYGLMNDMFYESGVHEFMIDGSRISEGMYVLRMEKDGETYSLPLVKID